MIGAKRKPPKSVSVHTRHGRIAISRDIADQIRHLTVPLDTTRAAKRGSYDEMMRILRVCACSMPDHFTSNGRAVLT